MSSTSLVGALGAKFPASDVLFYDNFETGFCGWRDHISGNVAQAPLGLASHPTYSGGFSLAVTTAQTRSGNHGGSVAAYKNTTRNHDTGVLEFGGWFAFGGITEQASPRSFLIGIDAEKWDASSRFFAKLQLERWIGSGPDVYTPRWVVIDDSGNSVPITNAPVVGWNENKWNFQYLALRMDLGANGGLGGYLSADIGGVTYDLTGLGAGRGAQSPAAQSSPFNGGLNFGISMSNRTATDDGPATLFADDLRAIHYT